MTEFGTLERKGQSPAEAGDRVAALLVAVGQRVRAARNKIGLSRRELSEQSGVSQRYLAQLEGGQGNISIALLMRIADALGTTIEVLVREPDSRASTSNDLSTLFAKADERTRVQVRALLDPHNAKNQAARRIALIGLRGAGKSTLGELAAHKLGVSFLELNAEIEHASGLAIEEVIELYGQDGFRLREFQALEQVVSERDELILAVAGGIVSAPETFRYLLQNFHTIWLRATPEEHMDRVRAQGDERPMAGHPDAMDDLRRILESREALYARAQLKLDTSSRSLDDTLDRLLDAIEAHGFLAT